MYVVCVLCLQFVCMVCMLCVYDVHTRQCMLYVCVCAVGNSVSLTEPPKTCEIQEETSMKVPVQGALLKSRGVGK